MKVRASIKADLMSTDFMTDEDRLELLGLLRDFFDRWEHFHRICAGNDREALEKAADALAQQARAVRAFYD